MVSKKSLYRYRVTVRLCIQKDDHWLDMADTYSAMDENWARGWVVAGCCDMPCNVGWIRYGIAVVDLFV